MIDLNVKGITIQMHIVVNDDGSFTVRYGEGNVSLSAEDAADLTTSRAITLNTPKPARGEEQVMMTESEMGAKLAGLIREAIADCIDKENSGLCTKNVKNLEDWNDLVNHLEGGFDEYYKDSKEMYKPQVAEDEDTDQNQEG